MPLKVNHVRVIIAVTTAEKMVQSDFIKRRRRSVGGNMAANVWMKAIGLDHHRHGVPTDITLDPPLNFSIAGIPRLVLARNCVDVGGADRARNFHPRLAQAFGEFLYQQARLPSLLVLENQLENVL